VIVGSAGLSLVILGTALALAAETQPVWAEIMETVAGVLIVAGLALLGAGVGMAMPPLLRFG
jgi:hypothetical protein